ncbi:MAG: bacterial Ig-like domain-containing protein, partial [Eubacterium sp.]
GADHKLPHANSDLVTFQVKVKEGVADGTPLSLSILSSSYISENKTNTIDYSFDAPKLTIKEFKPLIVKSGPTKITYIEGQDLDLTGGVLTYTNADGESSDILMTDSQVSVTGYNKTPDTYGEQTVTLTVNGESTTIKVTVEEKTLASIAVLTSPSPQRAIASVPQTDYIQGQDFGIQSDGVLRLTYNNGATADIPITDSMISTVPNMDIVGEFHVGLIYKGQETSYKSKITAKVATGINLNPANVAIKVGKTFDYAGVIVTTNYNNGKPDAGTALTREMLATSIDTNTVGIKNYTVSQNGQTATLTVDVKEKELTGITISKTPMPTEFVEGTTFSASGGKLELTYDNGTTEAVDITSAMVTGPDMTKVGKAKATVTYDQFSVIYDVTITAKSVESIAMLAIPKTDYIEGQALDITGGKITVTYDNGTSDSIDMTADMVSGFDSSKPVQSQTLTVTKDGKTTTYTISIRAKALTAITVGQTPQTDYFVSDILNLKEGTLIRHYDNDTTDELAMTDKDVSAAGFDSKEAGKKTVTLTYNGKTTTYQVTIMTKERMEKLSGDILAITIDTLSLNDKATIEGLKAQYDALTDLEKNAMDAKAVEHLNVLITKMNTLIEEDNKKQEQTGGASTAISTIETVNSPATGIIGNDFMLGVYVSILIGASGLLISYYRFKRD